MEEVNNILKDEEYVALINKISSSIYEYAFATNENYKKIQSIFEVMEDELTENDSLKLIYILSKSNEENLNNFFSDSKSIFKNLRIIRKEYLSNISNYFKYLLSENSERSTLNKMNNKQHYNQINLNIKNGKGEHPKMSFNPQIYKLLANLINYSDIIGAYSFKDKEQYIKILNMIYKELKKYEQNIDNDNNITINNNDISLIKNNDFLEQKYEKYEKQIQNYKSIINKLNNHSKNLENKLRAFSNDSKHIIDNNNMENNNNENSLISSVKILKEKIKKEQYNSSQKDKKIKELKEQNNTLFKKVREKENEIFSKDNQILSLDEENQLYKFKFNEVNRSNNKNKDIISNIKRENILINNYNSTINNNNNNNQNNNNNIDILINEKNNLMKENQKLKEINKEKEKNYNILEKKYNELQKSIIDKNEKNEKNNINNKENILKLNEEINNHKNKIIYLEKQLDNKEKEYKLNLIDYEKLKDQLTNKTNELEQYKKLKEEEKNIYSKNMLNQKNDNENNIKLINKLKNDNENNNKLINKLKNEINEKNNDIIKYKSLLNEKENKIVEYIKNSDINTNKMKNDLQLINDLNLEKNNLSKILENKENELKKAQKQLEQKEKEYNLLILDKNKLTQEIKDYKSELEIEKEKNLKLDEIRSKNSENIEKINLQTSQINNFQKTIDEKDELIKKLKLNYENDKISQYENDIKDLQEKNKLLLAENKELKQSKVILIQSTNQQMIKNNQSLNEYMEKVRELEQEKFLLESQLDETKKKNNNLDNNPSINFLYEEENSRMKSQIENLKKKNIDLENEIKLLKTENEEQKKTIDKLNKKENNKCLTQSNNNSNFEEEYDIVDLDNNARDKNNSEDMKIDFPGLNDIKNKYEELKAKIEELRELIKYIISHASCDDPDLQEKVGRACDILEINLEQ